MPRACPVEFHVQSLPGLDVSLHGARPWHLFLFVRSGVAADVKHHGTSPWHLYFDHIYRSFEKFVLPELINQNIGVPAMKTLANGTILESKTVTAIECLHYAMNLQTSVVITGCESMEDLEQALTAARTFKPMTDQQVNNILSRTAEAASRGEYELFKTTSVYDGTASHPEWLGEEPPEVKRVIQS